MKSCRLKHDKHMLHVFQCWRGMDALCLCGVEGYPVEISLRDTPPEKIACPSCRARLVSKTQQEAKRRKAS